MTRWKPEDIDPKYLMLVSSSRDRSLSRRDLLFGPLTARYEVVPGVEPEACTAWTGCAQCIAVCPVQAIAVEGTAATIDKARCTGCGACVPACPVGAVEHPLLSPGRLEADLRAALSTGEAMSHPRMLLLVADGEPPSELPSSVRTLSLPSIASVSPWLLLRAFTLGADLVAILPCGPRCQHSCDQARWQRALAFARAVLTSFGIGGDRLLTVSRKEGLEQLAVSGTGLALDLLRTRYQATVGERPTLANVLVELARAVPGPVAPVTGVEVPYGVVRVQVLRCTLCGACRDRCPSGALSLQESADSSRLLFEHSRCIGCEACVRVCPESAVQMERGLDISRLSTTAAILAEDEMSRCRRCGSAIAPRRMVRKVNPELEAVSLCADCRIFG